MKNSKCFCVLIDSNLLSVHVDSAFSLPDTWQIQMAQQYNYTASLPIPVSSEVRSSLDINIEIHKMIQVMMTFIKLQTARQGLHGKIVTMMIEIHEWKLICILSQMMNRVPFKVLYAGLVPPKSSYPFVLFRHSVLLENTPFVKFIRNCTWVQYFPYPH